MDEFSKCSARIVLLKEIREETLFVSTAPIGVSISILRRLPWSWRVKGWVYILQERPTAASGKMFTFLSRFFCLRLFSSDYWRQVYLHVTAVLSFVHWTQPCTPHAGTEEDGCRGLTGLASIPLPSKAAVAINRKKLNRRCFTVQFSEAAQMLILSMSAEEALGTGPCFYWSPSSSEATKAEEESFRALTDMFSSCTRLQGRTGR